MKDVCGNSKALARRYERTGEFLLGLFSSGTKAGHAVEDAEESGSAYTEVQRASLVPAGNRSMGCSILTAGSGARTFNLFGLLVMLFGSCGATTKGYGLPGQRRDGGCGALPRAEDPFTTMNGFGDRVY